ncbi:hypothetical protein ZWY2020_036741 [Hordeum vulgare]|nr:hypothetical protein ZWY2020_036741 [Hordeum vulgare]
MTAATTTAGSSPATTSALRRRLSSSRAQPSSPNSQRPTWEEAVLRAARAPRHRARRFQVKDATIPSGLAHRHFRLRPTRPGRRRHTEEVEWVPIVGPAARPTNPTALCRYRAAAPSPHNPVYRRGIPGDPDQQGVRI